MATTRGCRTTFYAGATPTQVREHTDFSLRRTAERIDVSEAGQCVKKFDAGAEEGIASFRMWENGLPGTDPAPDPGQALFDIGLTIDVEVRPNGDGPGKPQLAFNMTITEDSFEMNGVDGVWERVLEGAVNGVIDTTAQT